MGSAVFRIAVVLNLAFGCLACNTSSVSPDGTGCEEALANAERLSKHAGPNVWPTVGERLRECSSSKAELERAYALEISAHRVANRRSEVSETLARYRSGVEEPNPLMHAFLLEQVGIANLNEGVDLKAYHTLSSAIKITSGGIAATRHARLYRTAAIAAARSGHWADARTWAESALRHATRAGVDADPYRLTAAAYHLGPYLVATSTPSASDLAPVADRLDAVDRSDAETTSHHASLAAQLALVRGDSTAARLHVATAYHFARTADSDWHAALAGLADARVEMRWGPPGNVLHILSHAEAAEERAGVQTMSAEILALKAKAHAKMGNDAAARAVRDDLQASRLPGRTRALRSVRVAAIAPGEEGSGLPWSGSWWLVTMGVGLLAWMARDAVEARGWPPPTVTPRQEEPGADKSASDDDASSPTPGVVDDGQRVREGVVDGLDWATSDVGTDGARMLPRRPDGPTCIATGDDVDWLPGSIRPASLAAIERVRADGRTVLMERLHGPVDEVVVERPDPECASDGEHHATMLDVVTCDDVETSDRVVGLVLSDLKPHRPE